MPTEPKEPVSLPPRPLWNEYLSAQEYCIDIDAYMDAQDSRIAALEAQLEQVMAERDELRGQNKILLECETHRKELIAKLSSIRTKMYTACRHLEKGFICESTGAMRIKMRDAANELQE